MSNGAACGGVSAWSKPGGFSPLCYAGDISDRMVRSFVQRNNMQDITRDAAPQVGSVETVRLVQLQLNRLGCELGQADGIIGPRSRSALREFADAIGESVPVSNFRSQLFLRLLERQTGRIC
jgi:hypothetical protein